MPAPLIVAGAWAAITAFVARMIPFVVRNVLKYLGIGFVTYIGVSTLLSEISGWLLSKYSGLPAVVISFFDMVGVYDAIGMYVGAMSAIMAYRSAQAAVRMKRDADYIT